MGLAHVIAAALAFVATPAPGPAPSPSAVYVALGDSLTAPGGTYPDEVTRRLQVKAPRLTARRLGCIGITSDEILRGGGACPYREGSQLRTAEAYLRGRRGRVEFVTLTIGANDVFDCIAASDTACLRERLPTIRANITAIVRRLRRAAGRDTVFVATTYHDPFLGYWVQGREEDARASVPVALAFNRALLATYRAVGVKAVDLAAAFRISEFGSSRELAGRGTVPTNVEITCRLTLACPPDPAAFDVHPNRAGYRLIADLVVKARAAKLVG